MHDPVPEVGQWLSQVLSGHYRYYGVPRNYAALEASANGSTALAPALNRRSQVGVVNEARLNRIATCWLPLRESVILIRKRVWRHDPRQEPGAVNPPAGIRAGGGGQPPSLPRPTFRTRPRVPTPCDNLPRPGN